MTSTLTFYDLKIETLEDGSIQLEQSCDYEDPAIILLHPIQAAFIADGLPRTGPVRPQPAWALERIAILERRLLWARNRFEECAAILPPDLYERCAEAFEFNAWLEASITVATAYCEEFDINTRPANDGQSDNAEPEAKQEKVNKSQSGDLFHV